MRSDNMLALYAANHTHVKPQVFTGNDISIERTVNDFANLTISGRMQEKANWGKIDAVSSQSGTPTPENPIPIETNLPSGQYCFHCTQPRGGYYTFTLDEAMYSVNGVCDVIEADGYSGTCRGKRKNANLVLDGVTYARQFTGKNTDSGDYKSFFVFYVGKPQTGICNYMDSILWNPPDGNYYWIAYSSHGIRIHQSYLAGYSDELADTEKIAIANQWLADKYNSGVPVQFIYERATPTSSTIPTTWSATPVGTELSLDTLDATKSPEYPVSLVPSEGEVRSEGRNVWALSDPLVSSPSDEAGTYLFSGKFIGEYTLCATIKKISSDATNARLTLQAYKNNFIVVVKSNKKYPAAGEENRIAVSITIPNGLVADSLKGWLFDYSTCSEQNVIASDIMLVKGQYTAETMPPYQKYRSPSTNQIPVLRYISDDVRDTWEPRVWHEGAWRSRLTEKVGCYVFDGTEYFNGFALYEDRSKAYVQYRNYISNVNHPYYGKCVSNSFTWNGIASSAANPYGKFSINDTTLNFACSPSLTDVTSFRAYFAAQYAAGTPVTVWYALAAPIITYGDPVPINTYPYYTRLTTACEVQPDVSAKCKIIGG